MKLNSINPKTGEVIKSFDSTPLKDIKLIVQKAGIAQKRWEAKTKKERIKLIKKLKEQLIKNKDRLFEIIRSETSYDSLETEPVFLDIINAIDYYCDRYAEIKNIDFPIDQEFQPDTDAKINFIPHGVIGHIGIWNYPFWQTMISVIPALLTGNAVVFKSSEYVNMTSELIRDIIYDSGIPEDIFMLIKGSAKEGQELIKHVDAVVFTGGKKTGLDIIKNAGIKPLILELSGNDPAIICEDCDIKNTVKGICTGTFMHSGQVCIRIKRVYVPKKISKDFLDEFVSKSKKLMFDKEIYPLIRKEARDKVHKKVVDAVKKGSRLLLGGTIPKEKGFYYPPTILQIFDDDLEVIKDETFGPVCSVRITEDEDEAIRLANDSEYGLGASVWGKNTAKIADKLEAGVVWINNSNIPLVGGEYFQGIKESGISNSSDRLHLFLKKKTIINHKKSDARVWWF